MTKKDYKMIAECIKSELDARRTRYGDDYILAASTALESLAHRLSENLRKDNHHFNSELFIKACGF